MDHFLGSNLVLTPCYTPPPTLIQTQLWVRVLSPVPIVTTTHEAHAHTCTHACAARVRTFQHNGILCHLCQLQSLVVCMSAPPLD